MSCKECPLKGSQIIHGHGPKKSIMFMGEAPGAEEVEEKEYFVGRAGRCLDRQMRMVGLDRSQVSFSNTVRCRPTNKSGYNRAPTPKEIRACSVYLEERFEENLPRVIVTLGNVPSDRLLAPTLDWSVPGITKLRGRVFIYPVTPNVNAYVVPTYHPSYLLRNHERGQITQDFKKDLRLAMRLNGFSRPQLPKVEVITDVEAARKCLELISKQSETCVDVEGMRPDEIWMVGFTDERGIKSWVIPVEHPECPLVAKQDDLYEMIRQILWDPKIKKIGQNFQGFDRGVLEDYFDVKVQNIYWDTMFGSYIHDESSRIHRLELIASRWCRLGGLEREINLWMEEEKIGKKEIPKIPLEKSGRYCGYDTIKCHRSARAQIKHLNEDEQRLVRLSSEASLATNEMQARGIKFDTKYSKKLAERYVQKIGNITAKLQAMTGDVDFTPTKNRQIGAYIFETLKLPERVGISCESPQFKTKSGQWSTDVGMLKWLQRNCNHTFLDLVRQFRDLSKDSGTFCVGLQEIVEADGRVHVPVLLHVAATGRAVCRLHNIKKTIENTNGNKHYILLDQFVATPGYVLVKADYKQIEMRVAAEMSGDQELIRLFLEGRDIHHESAVFAYGLKPGEKETEEQRTNAKSFNFAMLYGKDAKGLYYQLQNTVDDFSVPQEVIQEFHSKFYAKYKRLREWQIRTLNHMRRHGFVEGHFGRTRTLDPEQGKHAENQALNSPIQSSAHDLLLVAMVQIYHLPNRDFYFLLDQHDALLFEVPKMTLENDLKRIQEAMENLDTERWLGKKLVVSTPVDISVGNRYGSMKPIV